MSNIDCPFRTGKEEVERLSSSTKMIIVDFHAEATSEKIAFGYFMDGKVSAVIGTHTHVQTADEKILPGGTAYITDVGMTGPYELCHRYRNRTDYRAIFNKYDQCDLRQQRVKAFFLPLCLRSMKQQESPLQYRGFNLNIHKSPILSFPLYES